YPTQSEFGKIILPFTVLRRLECVLEPTREAVLEQYEAIRNDDLDQDLILPGIARAPFYNTSKFSLATLGSTSTRHNLEEYISRFSAQVCLRPRDRFWDIPVPKIDSAFDNLFVPQPSWSPSTTQQLRKLVAAPYLAPNDWTPRSEAYFVFPLAQGTPGKQCGLAATGVYQPSLRSPWLAANARQIFDEFSFSNWIDKLDQHDLLYLVVKEFRGIDLHPDR
ncbi:type I restriction-modification system subunit M N-terminal domain-containing protein, partial [Thiolapillus sp.]